ncbi:hypothetical protein D3C87_1769320 [compost metagenome]
MAGIVETDRRQALFRRQRIHLERLGAAHVGTVAAEPYESRPFGGLLRAQNPHGDASTGGILANLDEGRFGFSCRRLHLNSLQMPGLAANFFLKQIRLGFDRW